LIKHGYSITWSARSSILQASNVRRIRRNPENGDALHVREDFLEKLQILPHEFRTIGSCTPDVPARSSEAGDPADHAGASRRDPRAGPRGGLDVRLGVDAHDPER
jgi:hypothetical protein